MEFSRASGVLMHVTSLPSYGGIGDLGPAAYEFVEFLAAAHQHVWQVLPLGPTGYGSSPYAGSSAFAGNPSLISLELLSNWGWIEGERIAGLPGRGGNVDFEQVDARKLPLLHEAAASFFDRGQPGHAQSDARLAGQWADFEAFCIAEAAWLIDYAFYAVMRREHGTGAWTAWPEAVRKRDAETLAEIAKEHGRALAIEQALQFAFDRQWTALRQAAARHSIRILGDVAIFVNMDSADVWVHPELFELDEELRPVRIAGVPPDYFSPTGQRWGNPLYKWDVLEASGFDWWVKRITRACQLYDIVRLDHFRGFEAYWAIPAEEETAMNGAWVQAPGLKLFQALERALGRLPLVAEDLGVITAEVETLRRQMGMPGMRVIQFGFSDKGAHNHLPHQYTPDTVAYTGTHDNDTTQGWWNWLDRETRANVETYIGELPLVDREARPVWPLLRAISASVAQMAVVPASDLLELDSTARMNTPAVGAGNWGWRAPEGCWGAETAARLAAIVAMTDRDNDPMVPVVG